MYVVRLKWNVLHSSFTCDNANGGHIHFSAVTFICYLYTVEWTETKVWKMNFHFQRIQKRKDVSELSIAISPPPPSPLHHHYHHHHHRHHHINIITSVKLSQSLLTRSVVSPFNSRYFAADSLISSFIWFSAYSKSNNCISFCFCSRIFSRLFF